MEINYKGRPVEVWEISKTNQQPQWVTEAFEGNYLSWYGDRLKVAVLALKPSPKRNIILGLKGVLGNVNGFGSVYLMGNIGDFLDITNGRIVSKKSFLKHYSSEKRQ